MERKAKIVATLGPSSNSDDGIRDLIEAGVNVFRLNFSHGSRESHKETLERIRRVSDETGKIVSILQDISGPKIRIGMVEGEIILSPSDTLTFTKESVVGNNETKCVSLSYPEIIDTLKPKDRIFLADGTIKVEVVTNDGNRVATKVLVGGKLTSRKGANFPGIKLPIPTITQKDKDDLVFGAEIGVDIIALSFVRRGADILEAKKILSSCGKDTPVFAKIEMVEAMENLDDILEVVDGIMVARGDLGVEFGLPKVPVAQKTIIKKANFKGLPVITATQMLTSMINSPYPTRAEVSDIANAILDGTDAVMLSDETAVGSYPVDAVQTLVQTIKETEKIYEYYQHKNETHPEKEAIALAGSTLAEALNPDAVIVFTTTGLSAFTMAKYRPKSRIIVASPSIETLRRLAVVWGVSATMLMDKDDNSDKLVYNFLKEASAKKLIDKDKKYVLTVGSPKSKTGSTNMIRILDSESISHILGQFS